MSFFFSVPFLTICFAGSGRDLELKETRAQENFCVHSICVSVIQMHRYISHIVINDVIVRLKRCLP